MGASRSLVSTSEQDAVLRGHATRTHSLNPLKLIWKRGKLFVVGASRSLVEEALYLDNMSIYVNLWVEVR